MHCTAFFIIYVLLETIYRLGAFRIFSPRIFLLKDVCLREGDIASVVQTGPIPYIIVRNNVLCLVHMLSNNFVPKTGKHPSLALKSVNESTT